MNPQDGDDDGTVIRPQASGSGASPEPAGQAEDGLALRIGTRIAEFEIVERIGEGGFSIVYLAMDHSLERTVALKEYMPSSLATRVSTSQVQPRSGRYRDTFEAGLRSFVNEAKLLAQFDHPALVKVYRFWESNGTAYMVMPFYQGVTLKDTVRALPAAPDEAWLMALLAPLTEALRVIHSERCFHRDIAPDNVLLLAGSGKPLLLDFGAARRVIGDMTQALTVILKPGYAPIEQYAEVPGMKQGPWTDVYALAAVVYWAVTGKTPPAAVGRMVSDSFVPLAQCAAGRYSLPFLQAIDRALVVLPERRTPSIDAFRRDLGLSAPDQPATREKDPDATVMRTPPPEPRAPRPVAPTAAEQEPSPGKTRRAPMILAGAAVAAALAAAGLWWALPTTGREHAPGPPDAVQGAAGAVSTNPPASSPVIPLQPSTPPEVETARPSAAIAEPAEAKPPAHLSRPATSTSAEPTQTEQRAPRAAPRPPETKAAASEECANITHRLSLGESSPELIARLRALNCR